MSSRLVRILGLSTALALIATNAAVAQTRTAPEPGKTYRIGYSQIVDHPALNATRQGFIDELKAQGFEVGKNLVFEYQSAQGNPGAAYNIIEKFIADKVDLLAPCTTPVVQATMRLSKATQTPVAFGCVTSPVETGVLASVDKPTGTNVTGFYTIPPVKQNLDLFVQIQPGIKRIGVIWTSSEPSAEALAKVIKADAERRGMTMVPVTITSSAEVKNATESLIGKVDAIVTPQDNTLASAYDALIKVARDNKMPWYSLDVTAVPRGAIAGLSQDQYQNGVNWAKKVAVPVLLGAAPGTVMPAGADVFEMQVNVAAAKIAGLTIPDDVRKAAKKVTE